MSTSNRVQQALDRVEDRTHATANGTAQVDAAVLAEEVKRLTAEVDELRLVIAAEHGLKRGALSGWRFESDDDERGEWIRNDRAAKVWWSDGQWVWGVSIGPGAYRGPKQTTKNQTARGAMLAADRALVAARETA
jgi:hypothetical protein